MAIKLLPALMPTKETTKVKVSDIAYVETLWNRLVGVRQSIKDKDEYLRIARQLKVKAESVKQVNTHVSAESTSAVRAVDSLERIKKLLALGAEPTSPPGDWYVGSLEKPKRNVRRQYPAETWPGQKQGVGGYDHDRGVYTVGVFTGPLPVHALQAASKMGHLVDDMRVYSPDRNHFTYMPVPAVNIDPVLMGRVDFLGGFEYFALARWDIDKDLAHVFTRGGLKMPAPSKPQVKQLEDKSPVVEGDYTTGTTVAPATLRARTTLQQELDYQKKMEYLRRTHLKTIGLENDDFYEGG